MPERCYVMPEKSVNRSQLDVGVVVLLLRVCSDERKLLCEAGEIGSVPPSAGAYYQWGGGVVVLLPCL